MEWVLYALLVALLLWGLRFALMRKTKAQSLDKAIDQAATLRDNASEEQRQVLNMLADFGHQTTNVPRKQRLSALREGMDNAFGGGTRTAEELGVRIQEVDADGVPSEWVLAPQADPGRRMLYIHGGAFFVGSRLSHRQLTAEFAKRTGLSLLVIDYRLMPENKRRDGIADCQNAYRWMLDNGPGVQGAPKQVFIAGDSAGANLTLMMTAWIRDNGLRQVDGAVALSPPTDSAFGSASLRGNIDTDPMLGPEIGKIMKLPRPALYCVTAATARMSPRNPLISPYYGDLSNLPPTLVQASESEMLIDDARRYAQKAQSEGSPITLQTWPDMVHVWQIFMNVLPQANEAFDRIAEFVDECSNADTSGAKSDIV